MGAQRERDFGVRYLVTLEVIAVPFGSTCVMAPKVAAAPLAPTIADGFTGYSNYFLFQRSADNSIIGFRLSENTGRARNVYFRKSSENR
jgi:hypothetical protein